MLDGGVSRSAEQSVRQAAQAFYSKPRTELEEGKKEKVCSGFLMCACMGVRVCTLVCW